MRPHCRCRSGGALRPPRLRVPAFDFFAFAGPRAARGRMQGVIIDPKRNVPDIFFSAPATPRQNRSKPMTEPRLVDPHDVVMTGENSFIRLSNDDGKTIADRVSHWRVLWSPAGQGHALFIESPLTGKGPRVYTDNAGVARFIQRTIEVLLYKDFASESLPLIDAEFERTGNSLSTVEERIISDEDEIILSYWDLMAPFVLTMPPGAMERPIGVYSTFLPARCAQLSVNSKVASAKVFLQDRFGKPSSSCCLAWSETWTQPRK
jgi:hypothetical protein